MPFDKRRLYVALYVRSGSAKMPGLEDTYHWGLIVGPKTETKASEGTRFHAANRIKIIDGQAQSVWMYEELPISMSPVLMILVRVVVAKVVDLDRLMEVLRATPLRGEVLGWNCISWVREALNNLEADCNCLGRSVAEWDVVRDAAMQYAAKKKAERRFDGQGSFDESSVPTFDLLEGKEIIA